MGSCMEDNFTDFQGDSDDGQEWEVDFDGGPTRTTSISWIAFRAMDDDEAAVTQL